MELQSCRIKQYSRRPNPSYELIPEAVGAPQLENYLLLNDNMKMVGRLATEGRPRTLIGSFKSERRRDAVFKSRAILKTHIATTT